MYTTLKKTEFLTIQEEMEGADHFPNFNKKICRTEEKISLLLLLLHLSTSMIVLFKE